MDEDVPAGKGNGRVGGAVSLKMVCNASPVPLTSASGLSPLMLL